MRYERDDYAPYSGGRIAFRQGKAFIECPKRLKGWPRLEWQRGWRDARDFWGTSAKDDSKFWGEGRSSWVPIRVVGAVA